MNRPLFLVGFMGSGKSAVGTRAAQELGLPFHDSDEIVARSCNRPIHRIFEEQGEQAFRNLERQVLENLCDGGPGLVATGGGAFQPFRSRRRMIGSGTTVWLDVPFGLIRDRLSDDPARPLWDSGDLDGMKMLYLQRRAAYALAGHRIDAADIEAAVDRVVRLSRER